MARGPARTGRAHGPAHGAPWTGVYDTPAPAAPDPGLVRAAHNVMLGLAGEWKGRPGFRQLAPFHPGGVTGPAQGFAGVTFNANDARTYAVVAGRLGQYDWSRDTWTDITPAGRVIAEPGRVALVGFAGQLIVSDGVNPPWALDPTSGAGAPVPFASGAWYGPPVVYYAKLFAILVSDRRAIEWSEEGVLSAGGTNAGAYNDGWTLHQTSEAALVALCATNERLYYFRSTSTGAITGPVSPSFQSSGVQDSVSTVHGACSPWGICLTEPRVWWLDQRGRLVSYAGGLGMGEHADAMNGALHAVDEGQLAAAWVARVDDLGALALGIPRPDLTQLLVVDTDGAGAGAWWGAWAHQAARGVAFAMAAECVDDGGRRRFVHLTPDGTPYVLAFDREEIVVDAYGGTTVPVPEIAVECAPMAAPSGLGPHGAVAWDLVTVHAGQPGDAAGQPLRIAVASPRTAYPAVTTPSTVPTTGRLSVGRARLTPLLSVRITGDAETRAAPYVRFRLFGVAAEGTTAGSDPRAS